MSNERYLIISYFAMGALSVGLAVAAWLYLRESLREVADAGPAKGLGAVLKNLFLVGIVLPTLFGFLSVSFKDCGTDTYAKIVADRSYLVAKNQEQLSSSLFYALVALMVWGAILIIPLAVMKRSRAGK